MDVYGKYNFYKYILSKYNEYEEFVCFGFWLFFKIFGVSRRVVYLLDNNSFSFFIYFSLCVGLNLIANS